MVIRQICATSEQLWVNWKICKFLYVDLFFHHIRSPQLKYDVPICSGSSHTARGTYSVHSPPYTSAIVHKCWEELHLDMLALIIIRCQEPVRSEQQSKDACVLIHLLDHRVNST